MKSYSRAHLGDRDLLRLGASRSAEIRSQTADHLADIAEIDARKLYRGFDHESMVRFLELEWGLSEDAAYKRIQAARKAREFPAIFESVAAGRLHLTAVNLLAPHLTQANVESLLAAAAGRTKSEVERLVAVRFPRTEALPLVETFAPSVPATEGSDASLDGVALVEAFRQLAPAQVGVRAPRSRVSPVAAQRFSVNLMMDQEMHDDLCEAQELLGHTVPSGDIAQVLHRGLKSLIRDLKKRKFGATDKPRNRQRPEAPAGRYVPADVRRAVSERDGGQCTYESASGRRCASRKRLEFDHIVPVARGGKSTADNLRLRCRAHNQYEAEQTYGPEFMNDKLEAARKEAAARRDRKAEEEREKAALKGQTDDLITGLRRLGYGAVDARRAAEFSETIGESSLEQRMRHALTYFAPRGHREGRPAPAH